MARSSQKGTGGKHAAPNQGNQPYTPSTNPYSRNNAHYRAGAGAHNQAQHGGVNHPVGVGANQYSRATADYSKKKRGLSRGKKIVIGVVCVLLVALVGVGVAGAWFIGNVDKTLQGNLTDEQRNAVAQVTQPTANFDKPFYMLLIGSDARADDASMGQRSDTNILVYVDPVQNIVSMVSIPRDTMIEINGNTEKFNAAYAYNGPASSITEANELCDVKISHYAEVNFENLIGLIDAVGGVEVDVPERINDPDAGNIVIEAGPQTLDGEAALVFARSRAYADGDFTRASNQRLLVEALINKVLSISPTELPNVIQKAAECVTTDFSSTEIIDLALRFQDGNITMYSSMVPSTTAMVGGVSYVLTYQTQLEEMMAVVESGGDPSTVNMVGTQADIRQEQLDLMSGSFVTYEDGTSGGYGAVSGGYDDSGYSDYGSGASSGYGYGYGYGGSSDYSDGSGYDNSYAGGSSGSATYADDSDYVDSSGSNSGGYSDDSYGGTSSDYAGGSGYTEDSGASGYEAAPEA